MKESIGGAEEEMLQGHSLAQFSWLTAFPPAHSSAVSSSRKSSLIPKLGQVPLGSPTPLWVINCLGTGLSPGPSLVCEPRKGRALVVLVTLCPLSTEEVLGECLEDGSREVGAGSACCKVRE